MHITNCEGRMISCHHKQNAADELVWLLLTAVMLFKDKILTMLMMLLFHRACQRLNIGINENGNSGKQRLKSLIQDRQIC